MKAPRPRGYPTFRHRKLASKLAHCHAEERLVVAFGLEKRAPRSERSERSICARGAPCAKRPTRSDEEAKKRDRQDDEADKEAQSAEAAPHLPRRDFRLPGQVRPESRCHVVKVMKLERAAAALRARRTERHAKEGHHDPLGLVPVRGEPVLGEVCVAAFEDRGGRGKGGHCGKR
jgi:hypothetical protein